MKTSVIFGALTIAGLAAGAAAAGTLDDVKARGKLNCGVTTGVPGFAEPDANEPVDHPIIATDLYEPPDSGYVQELTFVNQQP